MRILSMLLIFSFSILAISEEQRLTEDWAGRERYDTAQERRCYDAIEKYNVCTATGENACSQLKARGDSICKFNIAGDNEDKASCDTAYKEYSQAKRDSDKTAADRSRDSLAADRDLQKEIALLKEEIADIVKEQGEVKAELDALNVQIQQELADLEESGNAELAELVAESRSLLEEYQNKLGPELKAIYDTYEFNIKSLYASCKFRAERQAIEIVAQERAMQQAQNRGQIQSQSIGGRMGREGMRARIQRKVQEDYLACLNDGFSDEKGNASPGKNLLDSKRQSDLDKNAREAASLKQKIDDKKLEIDRKIASLDAKQKAKIQELRSAEEAARRNVETLGQKLRAKEEQLQKLQFEEPLKTQRVEAQIRLSESVSIADARIDAYGACCNVGKTTDAKTGKETTTRAKKSGTTVPNSFCADRKNSRARKNVGTSR